MNNRSVVPQPGKTYIMHTGEPKTIIFEFINPGHFRVNGEDKYVPVYSDLASPWTVSAGPFEYQKP